MFPLLTTVDGLREEAARTTGRLAPWRLALAAGLLIVVTGCAAEQKAAPEPGRAPPPPAEVPDALTGGSWLAEDIGGLGVVDSAQATVAFTADGRVDGSGGCNRYSGPVSIDGNAITFGALASTRKACVPALLDQDQRFFIALAGTRTYSLDGKQLTLRDAGGRPLVRLTRQP